ncbi:hypothetical protein O181_001954 [Austropuccinia psidii MF-1]|uniref:Uncharacterized protein n=1 Tax=Austropuccinia psidii MF-1 TaxID=1389203 RepID=A0A9Q3BBG7_9BASI|nr:hypothetical protein [Austropuccinia psidii MF-1]
MLVSTLNFNNLKSPKKIRDSFLGEFTIIRLIGKNEVEVKLTEELFRKHLVSLVRLVNTYHKTGEGRCTSSVKGHTAQAIAEVENYPVTLKKIITARRIRINGKDY